MHGAIPGSPHERDKPGPVGTVLHTMVATPYRPPRVVDDGRIEDRDMEGQIEPKWEAQESLHAHLKYSPDAQVSEASEISHLLTQPRSRSQTPTPPHVLDLENFHNELPTDNITKSGELVKKASGHAGEWKPRRVRHGVPAAHFL